MDPQVVLEYTDVVDTALRGCSAVLDLGAVGIETYVVRCAAVLMGPHVSFVLLQPAGSLGDYLEATHEVTHEDKENGNCCRSLFGTLTEATRAMVMLRRRVVVGDPTLPQLIAHLHSLRALVASGLRADLAAAQESHSKRIALISCVTLQSLHAALSRLINNVLNFGDAADSSRDEERLPSIDALREHVSRSVPHAMHCMPVIAEWLVSLGADLHEIAQDFVSRGVFTNQQQTRQMINWLVGRGLGNATPIDGRDDLVAQVYIRHCSLVVISAFTTVIPTTPAWLRAHILARLPFISLRFLRSHSARSDRESSTSASLFRRDLYSMKSVTEGRPAFFEAFRAGVLGAILHGATTFVNDEEGDSTATDVPITEFLQVASIASEMPNLFEIEVAMLRALVREFFGRGAPRTSFDVSGLAIWIQKRYLVAVMPETQFTEWLRRHSPLLAAHEANGAVGKRIVEAVPVLAELLRYATSAESVATAAPFDLYISAAPTPRAPATRTAPRARTFTSPADTELLDAILRSTIPAQHSAACFYAFFGPREASLRSLFSAIRAATPSVRPDTLPDVGKCLALALHWLLLDAAVVPALEAADEWVSIASALLDQVTPSDPSWGWLRTFNLLKHARAASGTAVIPAVERWFDGLADFGQSSLSPPADTNPSGAGRPELIATVQTLFVSDTVRNHVPGRLTMLLGRKEGCEIVRHVVERAIFNNTEIASAVQVAADGGFEAPSCFDFVARSSTHETYSFIVTTFLGAAVKHGIVTEVDAGAKWRAGLADFAARAPLDVLAAVISAAAFPLVAKWAKVPPKAMFYGDDGASFLTMIVNTLVDRIVAAAPSLSGDDEKRLVRSLGSSLAMSSRLFQALSGAPRDDLLNSILSVARDCPLVLKWLAHVISDCGVKPERQRVAAALRALVVDEADGTTMIIKPGAFRRIHWLQGGQGTAVARLPLWESVISTLGAPQRRALLLHRARAVAQGAADGDATVDDRRQLRVGFVQLLAHTMGASFGAADEVTEAAWDAVAAILSADFAANKEVLTVALNVSTNFDRATAEHIELRLKGCRESTLRVIGEKIVASLREAAVTDALIIEGARPHVQYLRFMFSNFIKDQVEQFEKALRQVTFAFILRRPASSSTDVSHAMPPCCDAETLKTAVILDLVGSCLSNTDTIFFASPASRKAAPHTRLGKISVAAAARSSEESAATSDLVQYEALYDDDDDDAAAAEGEEREEFDAEGEEGDSADDAGSGASVGRKRGSHINPQLLGNLCEGLIHVLVPRRPAPSPPGAAPSEAKGGDVGEADVATGDDAAAAGPIPPPPPPPPPPCAALPFLRDYIWNTVLPLDRSQSGHSRRTLERLASAEESTRGDGATTPLAAAEAWIEYMLCHGVVSIFEIPATLESWLRAVESASTVVTLPLKVRRLVALVAETLIREAASVDSSVFLVKLLAGISAPAASKLIADPPSAEAVAAVEAAPMRRFYRHVSMDIAGVDGATFADAVAQAGLDSVLFFLRRRVLGSAQSRSWAKQAVFKLAAQTMNLTEPPRPRTTGRFGSGGRDDGPNYFATLRARWRDPTLLRAAIEAFHLHCRITVENSRAGAETSRSVWRKYPLLHPRDRWERSNVGEYLMLCDTVDYANFRDDKDSTVTVLWRLIGSATAHFARRGDQAVLEHRLRLARPNSAELGRRSLPWEVCREIATFTHNAIPTDSGRIKNFVIMRAMAQGEDEKDKQ